MEHIPEVEADPPNLWRHDDDKLSKVFKALLSRPYQYHLSRTYIGEGKYACLVSVNGSVTVDSAHEEAIRRHAAPKDTTDEESGFVSTIKDYSEVEEEDPGGS